MSPPPLPDAILPPANADGSFILGPTLRRCLRGSSNNAHPGQRNTMRDGMPPKLNQLAISKDSNSAFSCTARKHNLMRNRRTTSPLLPLLLLLLCSFQSSAQTNAVTVREADAVCGPCHAEILANYLKTPMANASGLAMERLLPGSYRQPSSGVTYSVIRQGDTALLHYTIPTAPPAMPINGQENLKYFLGSGHLGLTYLYEKNGYWLESPVAFYAKLNGYAMKPGLENSSVMPPALPLDPTCLRCHMSGVQKQVAGTENLYNQLPFKQVGIICESCHGDTREHILSKGHAAVINPVKLSPERRDSTCIVCHLEGDTHVERRDPLDFKPGDDIRDYLAYFVHDGQNTTRRAVSEIEQFNDSRCKRVTGPSMSCMNCHDPHRSPAPAERVAYYRAKCLACHSAPTFASQHFPSNPDCTSCHMPKTGSENIAHVAWTDHRIRRQPSQPELDAPSPANQTVAPSDLVPILPGAINTRDLGLAYYDLVAGGSRSLRPKAEQLLNAAMQTTPSDALVLRTLGILAQMDGDAVQAKQYYRAALVQDPANLVSGTNLGTLLAAAGDLQTAAAIWTPVFEHNQDVPELGLNLAIANCRLGRKDLAQQVLASVLTYSPGLLDARRLLAAIDNGQQPCTAH
jgi:predicted CXXCH cytochrome family protein